MTTKIELIYTTEDYIVIVRSIGLLKLIAHYYKLTDTRATLTAYSSDNTTNWSK